MVGVTEVGAVLGSIKAAKDIAEAMVGLRDAAAFQAKAIELHSKIIDAQVSALSANEERSALVKTIADLEKEVARLKAWGAEKERYELTNVGRGVFAYAPKSSMNGPGPFHLLCARCYQHDKKSILQATTRLEMRERVHFCPECKTEFAFSYNPPASTGVVASE